MAAGRESSLTPARASCHSFSADPTSTQDAHVIRWLDAFMQFPHRCVAPSIHSHAPLSAQPASKSAHPSIFQAGFLRTCSSLSGHSLLKLLPQLLVYLLLHQCISPSVPSSLSQSLYPPLRHSLPSVRPSMHHSVAFVLCLPAERLVRC